MHILRKSLLLSLLLIPLCLCLHAQAAETITTVYLSASGRDTNSGTTPAQAVQTLQKAQAIAQSMGTNAARIVIMDAVTLSSTFKEETHIVPFVLTAKDGTTDYGAKGAKLVFGNSLRYMLAGDTTFENLTVQYDSTLNFVAQFHKITFGSGFATVNTADAVGVYVVGGYQNPSDSYDRSKDAHITIADGDFHMVTGFSRQAASGADKDMAYTGKAYIEVRGGNIKNLYSGCISAGVGGNAAVTISGGYVQNLAVSGDNTYTTGNIEFLLCGGTVESLSVNNAVGNVNTHLCGTALGTALVAYRMNSSKTAAINAGSRKTATVDPRFYKESMEDRFSGFDDLQNAVHLYVSENASGTGLSFNDPTKFATAASVSAQYDCTIHLIGTVTQANFSEAMHTAKLRIVGETDGAALKFTGSYTLKGPTTFAALTLWGQNAVLDARQGRLTVEKTVRVNGAPALYGSAFLYAGNYASLTDAANVLIDGATVETVTASKTHIAVDLLSGSIGTLETAESGTQHFSLNLDGGTLKTLVLQNITQSLHLRLYSGSLGTINLKGDNVAGTLEADGKNFSLSGLGRAASLFTEKKADNVRFVRADGNGTGTGANSATADLTAAAKALTETGGTIVICGPYTIDQTLTLPTSASITLTSVFDGVDYRKTENAVLTLSASLFFGGRFSIDNLTLQCSGSYRALYACGYDFTIGADVSCAARGLSSTYPSLICGTASDMQNVNQHVSVGSGTWQRFRGGCGKAGTNCNITLTVDGGTFIEVFNLGSASAHSGEITATVNGGNFQNGICGAAYKEADSKLSADIRLTVNGGTFYQTISVSTNGIGIFEGDFVLSLCGGDFAHLTDITGTSDLCGSMTATLFTGEGVNLDAAVAGTDTFANPIIAKGADPWLFYHDGYYWYTYTGGSSIKLYKFANLGDLKYVSGTTFFSPTGEGALSSIGSPEIHYYTDEEIGAGNGGWYCMFGSEGEDRKTKIYSLKCLDGDDLLGRWGNPITGEVGVPQPVLAPDVDHFQEYWTAGFTDIRINGKLYAMYVTLEDVGKPTFRQTINIIRMENPWSFVGKSTVICKPEYDWEKHGGVAGSTQYVVEGGTAVYAEDGSIYIIYSGSGYWTIYYQLGQLKYLGGDPLEAKNWEKLATPIFSYSNEINGCGHASYFTDAAGQTWLCYHGYIGSGTASGRYAFTEQYTVDASGVKIGDGSGHPAALDTVYTVALNPRSLREKISGFYLAENGKTEEDLISPVRTYENVFADVSDAWYAPYVSAAYTRALINGTGETTFEPDGTFTVAQAVTAAVNIHTAYYKKSVRATNAGEVWYTPYIEYAVRNGLLTSGTFNNFDRAITRGEMAELFAAVLPEKAYTPVRGGNVSDITADTVEGAAIRKLYRAGIVSGDAGSGSFRPGDAIRRSEACVILLRVAAVSCRAK